MANQDKDQATVGAKETTTQTQGNSGPTARLKPGSTPARGKGASKPKLG